MKRSMVFGVGCLLACSGIGVISTSAVARPATFQAAARPLSGKHRVRAGVVQSTNWSGYAAYGTTFKSVTGTWKVPTADCSAVSGQKETAAAFWAGLDGYTSKTVEQTGVDAICIGATAYYFPWYEFYPANSVQINHKVLPGDTMIATVSHSSTTVTTKLTDKGKWSTSASASAARLAFSSAEWIAEGPAPSLTDFGSVAFGSASATDSANQTGAINSSAWKHDKIIQVDPNGTIDATPTKLSNLGSAFDVLWKSF